MPHKACASALGDGALCAHAVVVSLLYTCRHAVIWTTAEEQQGDNRRTRRGQREHKRRTTGGQGLETGWQPWPSWSTRRTGKERKKRGQQEDKVWRPAGSRGQAAHQKKDKRRATGGQRPGNAFPAARDCGHPNSKLFEEKTHKSLMF